MDLSSMIPGTNSLCIVNMDYFDSNELGSLIAAEDVGIVTMT